MCRGVGCLGNSVGCIVRTSRQNSKLTGNNSADTKYLTLEFQNNKITLNANFLNHIRGPGSIFTLMSNEMMSNEMTETLGT